MNQEPDKQVGAPPWHLLEGYQPAAGVFDEMMIPPQQLRPHCAKFVHSLETLGRPELAARWETAKRAIRENGVTYNVYGDPQGMDRPWELDLIPQLIAPAEWRQLEAALIQRARLFNTILADLYGPQQLLLEGLLPPALVFANPAFLRPCHGIRVPNNIYLHLHAVDLARSPDGQWWALADRTQAPSGSGYALENRIVMSRTLPETYHDCHVHRLASFFRVERETLMALAPRRADNPRVVLLTPGPYNETYFEHAYLARYLGFPLVEGGDLTVRDRRVFIKTLEGLQPVDVILRRLDDAFCDPLELRGDSFLGVAGLVEAARAGQVTVANALGSGVTETAAILAFLPGLCQQLLGEELQLPSVATWWCGQEKERQYVLDHLESLVVKRAFTGEMADPIFGMKLSAEQRIALAAKVQARPHSFVGQEQVALSAMPVWSGHKLEARPLVMRVYIGAAGDSYMVMPGGLTRVSGGPDTPIVSMQSGGGSKDTWVLADGPVSSLTLLAAPDATLKVQRPVGELPSRVADNLHWLGRYAERAEDRMRLLRCVVARLTDETAAADTPEVTALLQMLVKIKFLPAQFETRLPVRELERELLAIVFKQQQPGSLRETLLHLRRTASIVRDRLSMDTWRILHQIQLDLRMQPVPLQLNHALPLLNRGVIDLAAFSGMEMENMTRGHGWRFLDIGRRLERSLNLLEIVRAALTVAVPVTATLEPLLQIADSTMTYRRRYYAQVQLAPVLDLLLVDESNPRSLAFQLDALRDHMERLPHDPHAPTPTREQALVAGVANKLRGASIPDLCAATPPAELAALLGELASDLRALSEALTHFFFSHAGPQVS